MNIAPLRILVVEDDEDDYVLVRDLLSESDESRFHLEWVADYDAGLRAIEHNQHDVYLLDYRLGERNGLELLREAQANGCKGPMILLTGQGDYAVDLAAMQAGAADFLVKGRFDAALLERSIRYGIERHRAEGILRQQLAAINTSMDGMSILNENGEFYYINDAMVGMFGYDRAELVGKPWQVLYDLEEVSRFEKDIMPVLWREGRWRGEAVGKRRDGSSFPQEVSMNTIEGGGLVCIDRDITERKKAEERIQESGRLASIGELAAGVAHEINNPLTSVLGFTQLILQEEVPKQLRDDLEKIRSEAQRAGKIVHNLLSFARKHKPEQQRLDLTSILERALELKSFDFKNGNIQLKRELSPDLPSTMVDEHQLVQVIMNLLTNAEQAMNNYQGRGQLIVRTGHTADRIRLSISDDGPGIHQESLAKIFEPFYTTKEVGAGTGLGLSICYGIIQQHGGDIWAESVPGQGTTFHIELPITSPLEEESGPSPTKHILVVDDEPHIRDLLARSLARERYTVDLAENGEEAWRKVQDISYDCIIMDLKMPGMSGPELFQHIKEYDQELAEKAIFITGDLVSPDTLEFVVTASNPTLTKPFDLEEIRLHIRTAVEVGNDAREPSYG